MICGKKDENKKVKNTLQPYVNCSFAFCKRGKGGNVTLTFVSVSY